MNVPRTTKDVIEQLLLPCFMLMLANISLGETGPTNVSHQHRGWTLKSHGQKVVRVLEADASTLEELDAQLDMARLCRNLELKDGTAVENRILNGFQRQLLSLPMRSRKIKVAPDEEGLKSELLYYYLDNVFRLFMEKAPKRFSNLPFLLSKRVEVSSDIKEAYVDVLLGVLWDGDDANLVKATCDGLDTYLAAWLSERDRERVADVVLRAELIQQGDQDVKGWQLIFEKMRAEDLVQVLEKRRRIQSNRWIMCMREIYGTVDPNVPLAMALANDMTVSDQYLLLDWACRAWNMSGDEGKSKKHTSNAIREAVVTFYQRHGKEVSASINADQEEVLLDYLHDTYSAGVGKEQAKALLREGE